MSVNTIEQRWLPLRTESRAHRARLFCFPHAGGSAVAFRSWQAALGESVDVCSIEYPGRWSRHREPPAVRLIPLAQAIVRELAPLYEGRFALFGYSYGALLAFEVARELRRAGSAQPAHLIVAARQAPQTVRCSPLLHTYPDSQFVELVDRRYGGISPAVRKDPDLLAMVAPVLRADMTALETYAYEPEPALGCPITAISGSEDEQAKPDDIAGWAELSTETFRSHVLAGGHFFIETRGAEVQRIVRDLLLES